MRPEIQRVLVRLRSWIRRYVLAEGIAATIALACLLFWLTFGLDLAWFKLSQLELPGWFRILCTIAMVTLIAGTAIVWIGLRLFRRLDQTDLALALERKFPELNDRLITAVQLSERGGSDVQSAMLERTTDEAVSRLSAIELKKTINPVPLKRMLTAASVLLASVLGLGLADAQGMERWYQAYILGRDDYWEPFRRNELHIQIVAQPGDRIRSFDARGIYKHPRGEDLQVLATVPESAVPPHRVNLQFIGFGGAGQQRGQVSMSRMGDDEFRHTFSRMVNDHQLWFRGGDYVNRQPFRVQVVDPPRVDSIELRCDYPSYTGLDSLEDRNVRVVGMQVALPMETEFELQASSNKPLLQVLLRTPNFELSFGFDATATGTRPTKLTLLDPEHATSQTVELNVSPATLFDQDRRKFHVPLTVTLDAAKQLARLKDKPEFPLPLVPDQTVQIILIDEDQIESPEPATLTVNGIVDQSPVVETRRTGIGTAVTRMASIPLEGKITDDYGVAGAWFGYRTNVQPQEQKLPLANLPQGQKEFRLQQTPEQAVERLNLIPLQLEDGQTLTLSVYAEDADNLNGPHVSHGELFTFQIVSKDDLLAKLFDREVTLRARFEQIRSEVQEMRNSLDGTRDQIATTEKTPAAAAGQSQVISAYVDRALHQIRKNHTESRSIELSFRDLRDEMVNNRIDTAELLERIERRIIEPMSFLNNSDFLDVDRRLGALRLAVERQTAMGVAAEEVTASVDHLLAQMDLILAEMKDRGTINDLIQNLQDIIKREKQLLEQIEEKRIEDSFFGPPK
ncbi:coiled-coil domain-containing protein [Planctomicrobium piriforme]|uniref:Uncharacterized protein n=1 Tax=Planctomicrobium piriforme TaxID=1576369 RepID=A0A1I3CCY0_9PLAN|nr:hypothetical protein [Planctomicrobium piriforme]SFH72283.1 hypothetical protein SAMN05421753_102225 [Planctomicrobium piriforme]